MMQRTDGIPEDALDIPPALAAAAMAADGMAAARAAALGREPVDRLAREGAVAGPLTATDPAPGHGDVGDPVPGVGATLSGAEGAGAAAPDDPAEGAASWERDVPAGGGIVVPSQRRTRAVALGLVAAVAALAVVDLARTHAPAAPARGSSASPTPHRSPGGHPSATPSLRAAGGSTSSGSGTAGSAGAAAARPAAAGATTPGRGGGTPRPAGAPAPAQATATSASAPDAATTAPAGPPPPCDASDLTVTTTAIPGSGITVVSTLSATRACTLQPVSVGQLANCPTQLSVVDGSSAVVWPTADRTESCAVPPSGPVAAGTVATVSSTWDGQVDGPAGPVPLPAGSYTAVGSWAVQTPSGPVVVQGSAPVSAG